MTPEEYFPPEVWAVVQKIGIRITSSPSRTAPNVLLGLYKADALPENVDPISFYKDFSEQTGAYFEDAFTPFFSDFLEAFAIGFDEKKVGSREDHAVFAATFYIHAITQGFEWTRQETNVNSQTTEQLVNSGIHQLLKRVDPQTGLDIAKLANIPAKVLKSLQASGFNLRITRQTPTEWFDSVDMDYIHQEYEEFGGVYTPNSSSGYTQNAWNTVWVFAGNDYHGTGVPPEFFDSITGLTPQDPDEWPHHVQVVIDVVKKISPTIEGPIPALILIHSLFTNGYLVRPVKGTRLDHEFEIDALMKAYINSMPLVAGMDIDPTIVLESLVRPVLKEINERGYTIVPNIHLVYGVHPHEDFQLLPRQVKNAKEIMRTLKRTQKRPLTDVEVDKLAINIKKMFKHHLGREAAGNEAFFVDYEDELLHDRTVTDVEPLYNVLRYLTDYHAPPAPPRTPKPKKFSEPTSTAVPVTPIDPASLPEGTEINPETGKLHYVQGKTCSGRTIYGDEYIPVPTPVFVPPTSEPERETGINPETGKLHYITGYKGGFCSPRRPVFGDAVPVLKTKPARDEKGKFISKNKPVLKRRGCS